jgi:aspartyl aminopeptidase
MTTAKCRLGVLMLVGIAIADPSRGDTLKVSPNQTYKTPSAAAAVVENGDDIEIEPWQYFASAVWNRQPCD